MKFKIATQIEDTTDKASWVLSSCGALTLATASPYCIAPQDESTQLALSVVSSICVLSSCGALTLATASPYCIAPPANSTKIEINEYKIFLQIAPI